MQRFLGLLGVVVLAGLLQARPPVPETKEMPDYYPLKAGAKWDYQVTTGDGNTGKITVQVAKIEKIDDKPLARLEALKDGMVVVTEHMSSDAKGVYRHRSMGAEVSPPVQVIKYPLKPGESWKQEVTINTQKMTINSKTLPQEEVTVPAGKFKVYPVQVEADTGGQKITTTYYFAPGMGPVKQIADLGGIKVTLELEKYQAGK